MEQKHKKGKKKINIPEGCIYFGCASGIWFFVKADDKLTELNLGQKDKITGLPKYLCTDKHGHNTGTGQAFEDLYFKLKKSQGVEITKVDEMLNGADFIVGGQPKQLKYSNTPQGAYEKLFDKRTGEYRYPGQEIVTLPEHEAMLRTLIKKNKGRLNGEKIVVSRLDASPITKRGVHNQLHKGFESMKIDAKDIITDPTAQKYIVLGLIASFCTIIGLGAIHDYTKNRKKNKNKSVKKAIGDSMTNSVKKHWGKALFASLLTGVGVFGYLLNKRQNLRPS